MTEDREHDEEIGEKDRAAATKQVVDWISSPCADETEKCGRGVQDPDEPRAVSDTEFLRV